MTPPVISSNGQVAFCNARFDIEHGRFRGLVDLGLLAFVDEGRGVFLGYGMGGLRLGRTVKGLSQDTVAESEGGYPVAAVVSPTRTEVVTLEQSPKEQAGTPESLVVRELPSLRVVRRTAIPSAAFPVTIGWMADGREVVRGSTKPCSAGDCPWTLLAVDHGALTPLAPIFASASRMVLDGEGARAVIATPSGVRVVALPSGEVVTEVDGAPDGIRALALSRDGTRVAIATSRTVSVYAPSSRASTLRRVHEASHPADAIQFAPNGQTLLVSQGTMMVALRNGLTSAKPMTRMDYAPRLPSTFESAAKRPPTDGVALETLAFGGDSRDEPGLFAWYRKRDHSVDVVGYAYEASQLDDVQDLEQWGRLIALRFGMTDAIGAPGWRVWKDDKQRSVTMVRRVREGCDPHDAFTRFTERDGVLYRISVDTAPGTSAKAIEPLARSFLVEPFGEHQAAKLSFKLPRLPWLPGPC